MHPVLLIDDILDLILFHLRGQKPGEGGRQPRNPAQQIHGTTLLSVALTCKACCEPAMRYLWYDIAGLDLLLLTMGQNVFDFQVIGDEPLPSSAQDRTNQRPYKQFALLFKRPPNEDEWKVFDKYAQHVRWFGRITQDWGPSADRLHLSESILEVLDTRFSETLILPNLRYLLTTEQQLRYTKHFLTTPTLHNLTIHFCTRGPFSRSLKSELALFFSPEVLQKLETLHFHCAPGESDLSPLICRAITDLSTTATVPKTLIFRGVPLPPDAISTAMTLWSLRAFGMDVQRFDISSLTQPVPQKALHTLDIHTYVLPLGADIGGSLERSFHSWILKQINLNDLRRFRFSGGPSLTTPQDLCRTFETFLEEHDEAILESIELQGCHGREDFLSQKKIRSYVCSFSDTFYVLCYRGSYGQPRFPHLHYIDLADALVDLSDEDFLCIGQALPHLTTFVVSNRRSGRIDWPRTTLLALWFLSLHCTNLERFGIWMNAVIDCVRLCICAGLGEMEKDEARKHAHRVMSEKKLKKLKIMKVGDSLIDNSINAGWFLGCVTPQLRSVDFNRENNKREVKLLWYHVNSMIRSGNSN